MDDPPVTADMELSFPEDQSISFRLESPIPIVRPTVERLVFQLTQSPQHGRLVGKLPSVTYLPDADYFGSDRLSFEVSDGFFDSRLRVRSLRSPV